jgi:hypothetical protein
VEDGSVNGVVDDDRTAQLEAELLVLRKAELRLQDRDLRQRVDLRDAPVGAVVEAAVHADGAIDAMHHPHIGAGKSPQALEVEVERVVETRRRLTRERVRLDLQAAALQLADERDQELVPASIRRRMELVEHGDVGAAVTRGAEVALGSRAASQAVQ